VVNEPGRWETGFAFEPSRCGAGGRTNLLFCDPVTMTPDGASEVIEGDAFLVYASDRCSPVQQRDFAGIARAQLEAIRSFELAEELWTGSLGLTQRSLTDPASDTVTNGPADPVDALACLEQGLARCNKGRRGMIHVTPQALIHLWSRQALRIEGGLVLTPLGTIVVSDAGYDGSGPGTVPAGASQWAYATSMVQVLLGGVEVVPPNTDTPAGLAEALDRSDDTVTVFATQPVSWKNDQCCLLAAELDLSACLIGGAS
jgi:hypothetical protein